MRFLQSDDHSQHFTLMNNSEGLFFYDGSSSYIRMGDTIGQDSAYPAQAAETGIFTATTGHYAEEHQSGMLHLAGNASLDPSNPIPVVRDMTQINPIGTPHILQSSTANLHNNLTTSSTVTYNQTLNAGIFTESLTAPSAFNIWSADNTHHIFVNQNLTQTGDTRESFLNIHNHNIQADSHQTEESGDLRIDEYGSHTETLAHTLNADTFATYTKSVDQSQEQTKSQELNIQHFTRSAQKANVMADSFALNGPVNTATNTTYIKS